MNRIATRLPLHTPRRARARAPRPSPCSTLVPRCGRARCPHRAAAPSVRCAAWNPAPHARAPLPTHHYTRALPVRRDENIAPYRNYTRDNRTLCPRPSLAPRCAILHYTRAIPALHCPWGLPTPGGAPRRTPFLSAHAASRCRVLGHNDHSNSRFCLKVRKRLGRSLTFVCGIAAHGNHAKKILPLSDSFAKRHHLCPNPKHRNRAAKQSKDGVSFVRSFCENPPFFPPLYWKVLSVHPVVECA